MEEIPPPPAAGGLCPAACAGSGEGRWSRWEWRWRSLGFPPESPHDLDKIISKSDPNGTIWLDGDDFELKNVDATY
jgi:hypothetical protein